MNGFADTLGYYGFKPVRFMFQPLVGPTTARDLVGNLPDRLLLLPLAVGKRFNRVWYTLATVVVSAMEHRSRYDDQLETLRSTADPHASSREFYLRKRQAEINELRGRQRSRHEFSVSRPSFRHCVSPAIICIMREIPSWGSCRKQQDRSVCQDADNDRLRIVASCQRNEGLPVCTETARIHGCETTLIICR